MTSLVLDEDEPGASSTVLAIQEWKSNAELIADCAKLGYITGEVLDPTYGLGTFWKIYKPDNLTATDIAMSPYIDFTDMPWDDREFDTVVFDPPYKLNGTPDPEVDKRYGVDGVVDWRERMALIQRGLAECCRVSNTWLLLKCKDQVCSGKVRWQTFEFTLTAKDCGFGLVDRLDMLSYRPQPEGTSQIHARRNASTMLVFKRGWKSG